MLTINYFLPFIIVYGVLVALMLLSFPIDNRTMPQRILFLLGWLALMVFVGFRDVSVGSDTDNYINSFHHPEAGYGENGETDPGFLLYLYLTHYLLFDSGTMFLVLSCILALGGIGYCFFRNSEQPVLTLAAFATFGTATVFLFHHMSAVRQSIAEGIFLVALTKYLGSWREERILITRKEDPVYPPTPRQEERLMFTRNKGVALLLFFIASLFHGSVWAMLPVVALAIWMPPLSHLAWYGILLGTYLFGVISPISVQDIVFAIFSVFSRGSSSYLARYGSYSTFTEGASDSTGLANPNMWPFTILALLTVWCSDERTLRSRWLILFLFSVVLNNLFNDNIIWSRLFIYLSLLGCFVVVNVIEGRQNWFYRIIFILLLAYFIVRDFKILFAQWILPTGNLVLPYSFTDFTI